MDLPPEAQTAPLGSITLLHDGEEDDFLGDDPATLYQTPLTCVPRLACARVWRERAARPERSRRNFIRPSDFASNGDRRDAHSRIGALHATRHRGATDARLSFRRPLRGGPSAWLGDDDAAAPQEEELFEYNVPDTPRTAARGAAAAAAAAAAAGGGGGYYDDDAEAFRAAPPSSARRAPGSAFGFPGGDGGDALPLPTEEEEMFDPVPTGPTPRGQQQQHNYDDDGGFGAGGGGADDMMEEGGGALRAASLDLNAPHPTPGDSIGGPSPGLGAPAAPGSAKGARPSRAAAAAAAAIAAAAAPASTKPRAAAAAAAKPGGAMKDKKRKLVVDAVIALSNADIRAGLSDASDTLVAAPSRVLSRAAGGSVRAKAARGESAAVDALIAAPPPRLAPRLRDLFCTDAKALAKAAAAGAAAWAPIHGGGGGDGGGNGWGNAAGGDAAAGDAGNAGFGPMEDDAFPELPHGGGGGGGWDDQEGGAGGATPGGQTAPRASTPHSAPRPASGRLALDSEPEEAMPMDSQLFTNGVGGGDDAAEAAGAFAGGGGGDDDDAPSKEHSRKEFSARTRNVLTHLQRSFAAAATAGRAHAGARNADDDEAEEEEEPAAGGVALELQPMLEGESKSRAARLFFEVLVLSTKGFVLPSQAEPYGPILMAPTAKMELPAN